jgi:D-3-phosphoglycerate dehydrogenase
MKILVADEFEQSGLDLFRSAGCEVVYRPDLSGDALAEAIRATGADVLVVRGTEVRASMIESGALSLIVRAGAGYNTIDVAAASHRGIYVSNCPGKNAIAVAELAFGLILALDRRLPDNVADLGAGRWNKQEYSKARGLFGRVLGLLGYGYVGREVAVRARAFGMPVVVWSRRFSRASATVDDVVAPHRPSDGAEVPPGIEIAGSPLDVAARADVLSIHLALGAETRGLVNAAVLNRLKRGAYLINTARAELVDAEALEAAVHEKGIRVALDVFRHEPSGGTGELRDPLLALPNVYGTHHIGASTEQAQEAIAAETVRIVVTYKRTGQVPNVVNLARTTPATARLVVRHLDRPGVLADVFDHLRAAHINVQEMSNVVFEGADAAVAHINLDADPPDALLELIKNGNSNILELHLVPL